MRNLEWERWGQKVIFGRGQQIQEKDWTKAHRPFVSPAWWPWLCGGMADGGGGAHTPTKPTKPSQNWPPQVSSPSHLQHHYLNPHGPFAEQMRTWKRGHQGQGCAFIGVFQNFILFVIFVLLLLLVLDLRPMAYTHAFPHLHLHPTSRCFFNPVSCFWIQWSINSLINRCLSAA